MPQTYSKNYKYCCSCDYWGGIRTVDSFGLKVTVDSLALKGKCLLQGGPWKGQNRQANMSCNKWVKWAALK